MRKRRQMRTLTRLWEWMIPGLIALEPGAMAIHLTSRETRTSATMTPDFAQGLVLVVEEPAGQIAANGFRAEGFGG